MTLACLSSTRRFSGTTPDSEAGDEPDYDTYIGRSEMVIILRVVSVWICILLYG